MSAWDIYWLTRLEPLREIFTAMVGLLGISFSVAVILGPLLIDFYKANSARCYKFIKVYVLVLVFSILGFLATPTKSDLAIIFAGQWVTNSEEMQKLPNNVARTINKFMSEYLEEKEGKEK